MVRGLLVCLALVFVASAQNAQSNTGTIRNLGQLVGGFNQRSFVQSGFGQQGFGQTGLNQPGFGQSGLGQSGLNQPGFGQSGFGQPSFSQPGLNQPGFGQSGLGQSGLNQPSFSQPGLNQPGFGQSGLGQSGFNQPGFSQPGLPGLNQPGFGQPGFGQRCFDQLGIGHPDFPGISGHDGDGDGVHDQFDICPKDSGIHTVDFRCFGFESLDEITDGQKQAKFEVNDQGDGITQNVNSKPGLMYGPHNMKGLDFNGKFIIDGASDDDYVGFIFGYNSPQSFYVVMWKKEDQGPFGNNKSTAKRGLQLKRVHSIKGPSSELQTALWADTSTIDQATILWDDFNGDGWNYKTTYDWELIHRPNIGLIRFKVLKGTEVIADSGNIYDDEIKGGHIGVYCHSQEDIVWSKLRYNCDDDTVPIEIFNALPKHKQNMIQASLRHW